MPELITSGRMTGNDTCEEVVLLLSGGNNAALAALCELLRGETSVQDLCVLDQCSVWDDDLATLYRDCCQRNIDKLAQVIRDLNVKAMTPDCLWEHVVNKLEI